MQRAIEGIRVQPASRDREDVAVASALLGASAAAFFDGIVLHQLLQWHHYISSQVHEHDEFAGVNAWIFSDGAFLVVPVVLVAAGVAVLWSTRDRAPLIAVAGMFVAGFGFFNLLDGVINHHLLGLHHIREGGNELASDLIFDAIALTMLAAGLALHARFWSRRSEGRGG